MAEILKKGDVKIIDLVKEAKVEFVSLSYPTVTYKLTDKDGNQYQFEFEAEETKGGVFKAEDKAQVYMRWIRKALEGDGLLKL